LSVTQILGKKTIYGWTLTNRQTGKNLPCGENITALAQAIPASGSDVALPLFMTLKTYCKY